MASRVTRDSPWQTIESIIEAEIVMFEPSLTCSIPSKLAFSIWISFIDGDNKAIGQSLIRAVESASVALGVRTRPTDESTGQPTMMRFDKMLMPVENRGGLWKKEREVPTRVAAHGEADQNTRFVQLRKLEFEISMCFTWLPKTKPSLVPSSISWSRLRIGALMIKADWLFWICNPKREMLVRDDNTSGESEQLRRVVSRILIEEEVETAIAMVVPSMIKEVMVIFGAVSEDSTMIPLMGRAVAMESRLMRRVAGGDRTWMIAEVFLTGDRGTVVKFKDSSEREVSLVRSKRSRSTRGMTDIAEPITFTKVIPDRLTKAEVAEYDST